jgi:hypothetical protein
MLTRATKDGVGTPVELWRLSESVLRTGDENPWVKALERCRDEAKDAGLIEVSGMFRRKVSADPARLEPLVPAFDQAVARLKRADAEEHDLVAGIWADCDLGMADRQVVTRSV